MKPLRIQFCPCIRTIGAGLVFTAAIGAGLAAINKAHSSRSVPANPSAKARAAANYARLPMGFEPAAGNFIAHGSGYTVGVTPDGASLSLRRPSRRKGARSANPDRQPARLAINLIGANPTARTAPAEELPGKTNYLLGNDPSKWRIGVPNYAKVKSEDVYPGIDLIYYGNQRELEYDFVVGPRADPSVIQVNFQASPATPDRPHLAENGDLLVPVGRGEVRVRKPVAYQPQVDGGKRYISVSYVIGPRAISFRLGAYEQNHTLVIDPVVGYSTYLGGSLNENDESGGAIAVDLWGDAYVTGDTDSPDFPITNGVVQPVHAQGADSDVFVAELSADGSSLVYSTFLGGTNDDAGLGIAVDLLGNAYIAGDTTSVDFPVTPGAFQTKYGGVGKNLNGDGFVAKLSPNGSALVYSTYLGGSSDDVANAIAVDLFGFAYIAGWTSSADFPVTPGAAQTKFGGSGQYAVGDAFVTKLNAQGAKEVYSTFLGGSDDDYAVAIAIDVFGNAFVAGATASVDFPVTPGAYQTKFVPKFDGLVAKLNPTGSKLIYSTYLSGDPANDECLAIALDIFGNAYVAGDTTSPAFPVSSGAFQKAYHGSGPLGWGDGFVSKLNASGNELLYSTYLGGSGDDAVFAMVVDFFGRAYVTGFTTSTDFPITSGAFQTAFGGSGPNHFGDAVLTVLNTEASRLLYSTYFGGTGDEVGHGIARDWIGNIYITGSTSSPNLYVTPNAVQTKYGGTGPAPERTGDAFVVRFNHELF